LLRALALVAEWLVYEGLGGLPSGVGEMTDDGGHDPLA
jgi:hypothetical protein